MKKLLTLLNHERYQVICLLVCLVVIFSGICCESQTRSIADPTKKVTRAQLAAEVDKLIIDVDQRYADLDRQDELKALLYEHLSLWSTTGTFNPTAIVPLLASVLGVGAIADNVRKRRDLKSLSNKDPAGPPTTPS